MIRKIGKDGHRAWMVRDRIHQEHENCASGRKRRVVEEKVKDKERMRRGRIWLRACFPVFFSTVST